MIDWIIFDCDGVLVDSEVLANRVGAELKTKFGLPYTLNEHILKFCGLEFDDPQYQLVLQHLPLNYLQISEAEKRKRFDQELKAIDGVVDVLENLRIPYALASNGSKDKVRKNLELTGLRKYFIDDLLFTGDLVSRKKPFPDLYLYAADRLGVSPEKCLAIEDSAPGVRAAKTAGMNVFAFGGGSHMSEELRDKVRACSPTSFFNNMKDLANLIEAHFVYQDNLKN